MRDLTSRGIPAAPSRPPKGIAFEIADLVLIESWAAFHGLGMSVRLDQGAEGERRIELTDLRTCTEHVPPLSGAHLRAQAAYYWNEAATEVTAAIRLSLLRLAERCESLALSIDVVERGC
jgi:hypothetical protein